MKTGHKVWTALGALAVLAASGAGRARDRDPDDVAARAQERIDRATRHATERDGQRGSERAAEAGDRAQEREGHNGGEVREVESRGREAGSETESGTETETRSAEIEIESAASSRALADIAQIEDADHDDRGFPVRRGELVAMDLPEAALASASVKGFRVIEQHRLAAAGHELVRLATPRGMKPLAARAVLRALAPGAEIDLVHYYGLSLTAGEKPHRLKQPPAAAPRLPSGTMTVGMIDTAVAAHPALGAARVMPWADGAQTGAPVGHGTAVASLIAAEGRATIYAANIFRGPAARPFTSADIIAEALGWMLEQRVPIINMSLAGPRNAILDRLVRDALGRGQTVVAAAGNGGPSAPPAWPAAVPGVVAVTAVDKDLRIYRYANRGRYISVAARGVDVVAAQAPAGFARFTGTSFATPHVAGWLGRCRAEGGAAEACIDRLRKSARDLGAAGYDDVYGFGFVD